MRLATTLCAALTAIILASAAEHHNTALKKCCPNHESLIKVQSNITEDYQCFDSESAQSYYNIQKFSSIVISDSITVTYGFPDNCDELQSKSKHIVEGEMNLLSTLAADFCYDILLAEISNTTQQNIPKTVALICKQNKTESKLPTMVEIECFRKCCPKGQVYDSEFHLCRASKDADHSVNWLLEKLTVGDHDYIYKVDEGLHCKSDHYSVELVEGKFNLNIDGSNLNVLGDSGGGRVLSGDWCVDTEFSTARLVARVCTQDCAQYNAFCIRKCCPVGSHYEPYRCGSMRSQCVSSDGEVTFNVSSYLDPLKEDYGNIADIMGIREGLTCAAGRMALNHSLELDRHWLRKDGLLGSDSYDPHQYCLETFDLSKCHGEQNVYVSSLICFVSGPAQKNFLMAAVANTISAACLLVTLVVYCCLPELRNLHGRTLICHVSTMLLAYSCLARPQYSKVHNNLQCKLLGYGMYFGFVGAFFWLNVMCFDIWWTFGSMRAVHPLRKAGKDRRRFLWYSVYAWGASVLLTAVMYLCDVYEAGYLLDADIGLSTCWFASEQNSSTDWPHYILFVIPMGMVTGVNVVLYALTARHCARVKAEVHRLQAGSSAQRANKRFRVDRAKYLITGRLWVVMGAGWFSELLSTIFSEPPWLWAGIDLINELQGVFIFLILVFKPKVYRLIRKRLGCPRKSPIGLEKPDSQKNGTSSSSRTSTTFLSRTISQDERTNLRTSLPNDSKRA